MKAPGRSLPSADQACSDVDLGCACRVLGSPGSQGGRRLALGSREWRKAGHWRPQRRPRSELRCRYREAKVGDEETGFRRRGADLAS